MMSLYYVASVVRKLRLILDVGIHIKSSFESHEYFTLVDLIDAPLFTKVKKIKEKMQTHYKSTSNH